MGAAKPLTNHPILAAKLIDDTLVSHSDSHKSTKIPNPCLVPMPSAIDKKRAITINHP